MNRIPQLRYSFAPLGLGHFGFTQGYALGCILTPLRGCKD